MLSELKKALAKTNDFDLINYLKDTSSTDFRDDISKLVNEKTSYDVIFPKIINTVKRFNGDSNASYNLASAIAMDLSK